MSPLQKKPRNSGGSLRCAVSTTYTGQKLTDLLAWLRSCGTKGLEDGRIDFLHSDGQCGGSLGGFAAKDFEVGELLFAIPLTCIISLKDTLNSRVTALVRDAAKFFRDTTLVTSELLIWLFMIQQLGDRNNHFSPFVESLDSESPSPLSWPKDLASALIGTNMSTMTSSSSSVEKHSQFLDEVRQWALETNRDCSFLPPEKFNLTSLVWARGHYLARRYPGKFCFDSCSGDDGAESISAAEGDGREQGMMNLGALVPLLDILNHNPESEWLTFKVIDGFLNVTCNHPVVKGCELYSNYGSLSNEMLLYAYGFCLESNSDDAVTLQLMGADVRQDNGVDTGAEKASDLNIVTAPIAAKHIGTYYVRKGGFMGVPNELWEKLTSLIGEDFDENNDALNNNEDDANNDDDDGRNEELKERKGIEDEVEGEKTEMIISNANCRVTTLDQHTDIDAFADRNADGDNCADDDISDDELAVEIGIEECEILSDSLQKKLDVLLSTQNRANTLLDKHDDPRSLYVRWYRYGQKQILEDTLAALHNIINGADSSD